MRTALLTLSLFSVACGPEVLEVCRDRVDNDGDTFVDEDCPESGGPEICVNFIDDDRDGVIDCEDADCFTMPYCHTETGDDCFDNFDNDLDGLTDCEDPDCDEELACTGGAMWTVWGDAEITATNYTGTRVLEVIVGDNDGGQFEIGDLLCETTWDHFSTSVASNCDGCDFAFYLSASTGFAQTGPYCNYWQAFTNPDSGRYYGVGSFPNGLGYNPAYDSGGTVFPALMFSYTGSIGWYALPSRAEFDWDEQSGEFHWELLWAYDYYR
ncbi:MAG: hypothetical protein EP330_10890 [Deltaproteobacteria bacterium]|nr:MAG: hypothetical protein EP330_10890 [Deltaproteobacteria bacterium]